MIKSKGEKKSNRGGRPSKWNPNFIKQARKACRDLEATTGDLADLFNVSSDTICKWINKYPEFSETIKKAKEQADRKVEKSLITRATGYNYKSVKIFCDNKTGTVTKVPYVEHCPPDPACMIFWLKNRQPKKWRDKHPDEIERADGLVFFDDSTGKVTDIEQKPAS